MWCTGDNITGQIGEAIWTFGRVFFSGGRRRDHRLDQSVVLSEPSETCGASNIDQRLYEGEEVAEPVIKGQILIPILLHC